MQVLVLHRFEDEPLQAKGVPTVMSVRMRPPSFQDDGWLDGLFEILCDCMLQSLVAGAVVDFTLQVINVRLLPYWMFFVGVVLFHLARMGWFRWMVWHLRKREQTKNEAEPDGD